MKRSKESILKDAILKEDNSLYISQLVNITGQTPKAVKDSVNNMREYIKDKAQKENKTFEQVLNELNKNNKTL